MPIFPFIAGLAAGVVVVRLYKNEQLRVELQSAGQKLRQQGVLAEGRLRQAAASGLNALAGSSARLRDRLQHGEENNAAITFADKTAPGKRKPAAKPVRPARAVKTAAPSRQKVVNEKAR